MTEETSLFQLSSRLDGQKGSPTLALGSKMKGLIKKGVSVVNFTSGEPDFDTPSEVILAAEEAMRDGYTRYTPVAGLPELRERIAKKFEKENKLPIPADHIQVSSGAKQCIWNFLFCVLREGDEVIIPKPYWVSYPSMVEMLGGKPVFWDRTDPLKEKLSERSRVLILNSPNNPSGEILEHKELEEIGETLRQTDVLVLSDEIYEKINFTGKPFVSFGSISEDAFRRTLTVNGVSKAYAMTGWRIGYCGGPASIIKAMNIMQGQSTSCANAVAQRASLAALDLKQTVIQEMVDRFKERQDELVDILEQSDNLKVKRSHGSFYLFLDVSGVYGSRIKGRKITDSEDFAELLLEEARVGVVPGKFFGDDTCVRLSFATSLEDVKRGGSAILELLQA
jgi:aspartate aminotransferase